MSIILVPLLELISTILSLYTWGVIFYTILSWLTAFQVVNPYNRFVFTFSNFLSALIDPFLTRIRRIIPPISGIDLSPIILILFLSFLQKILSSIILHIY